MNTASFLKGAAAGLLLGATVGILFAPKSGKETREDIKEFMDDINEKLISKLGKIKDLTIGKYDQIVGEVVESYNKISLSDSQKEDIRNELKSCYSNIKAAIENKE